MLEREYITLKNLTIIAKHGVSDWENEIEQEFQFDVKIFSDYAKAAINDDVEQTVSLTDYYEFLKHCIVDNRCRLVENLATEVARSLMDKYPTIDELQLEVRKNPLPGSFRVDHFCCGFNLKKEVAYLSLECGVGNKEKYLNEAVHYLQKIRGINNLKVSDFVETESASLVGVVKIATYLEPEELLGHILAVEQALIQTKGEVWDEDQFENDKICDIDIIFFGNKKIRTEKLTIPHRDLQNKDFLKKLLKSIEPFFDFHSLA